MLTDVLPKRGVKRQLQQTAMILRELEFTGRAQHALAFNAAQLADFDQEGLAILARWQLCPDQRTGHLDANACIGRAANNGQQTVLPHIDLAHAQAIGIRVLRGFLDFTHHDVAKRRRHRLELFHLKPRHRQCFSELLSAQRRVAKFSQPGFWKLHGLTLSF